MQDLCGMSHKEIINILRKIQEICSNNNCDECPFGDEGNCVFHMYSPNVWKIIEEKPQVWKVFY